MDSVLEVIVVAIAMLILLQLGRALDIYVNKPREEEKYGKAAPCPKCGSHNTVPYGYHPWTSASKEQCGTYCADCGHDWPVKRQTYKTSLLLPNWMDSKPPPKTSERSEISATESRNFPGLTIEISNNPVAALTDYELHHLATHLDATERFEDLHRLLGLETNQGRNAWYEAKEALGDTHGYLGDVALAWRIAEAKRDIPKQINYALCQSSVSTMAANYPPDLPALAVQYQCMTPDQALSIIEQMPDREETTEALSALIQALPEKSRAEALAWLKSARMKKESRVKRLILLVRHLPGALKAEALQEALNSVQFMIKRFPHHIETSQGFYREDPTQALIALVPHLSPELLEEAVASVTLFKDEGERAESLIRLAPHLRGTSINRALGLAREIGSAVPRGRALAGLLPHVPEVSRGEVVQEALAASRSIVDERARASSLMTLVKHLPQSLPGSLCIEICSNALSAVRSIDYEKRRALELSWLASHLPSALQAEALGLARSIQHAGIRAHVLTTLTQHLPGVSQVEALKEALEAAERFEKGLYTTVDSPVTPREKEMVDIYMPDRWTRHDVLRGVAPYLRGKALKQARVAAQSIGIRLSDVARENQQYAQERAETIGHEEVHTVALIDLVRYLLRSFARRVSHCLVNSTESGADSHSQFITLTSMAPRLPEGLQAEAVREALARMRTLKDQELMAHTRTLTDLIPHLSKAARVGVVREALAMARTIGDERARAKMLVGLISHLPESLQGKYLQCTFQEAGAAEDKETGAMVLIGLASVLPEALQGEAMQYTLEILGPEPYLYYPSNPLQRDALLGSSSNKGLRELAPHLSEAALTEILRMVRSTRDESSRANVLKDLAPYLPGALMVKAWEIARNIRDESERTNVLLSLAPHLPEALLTEALEEVRSIRDEGKRGKMLLSLVPYLPVALMTEASEIAKSVEGERERVRVLTGIPRPPEALQSETLPRAVVTAQSIEDGGGLSRALTSLIPHLPESLQMVIRRQALAAARGIDRPRRRFLSQNEVMTESAPDPDAEALQIVFAAARMIEAEEARAVVLANLVAHLPAALQVGALQHALKTAGAVKRVNDTLLRQPYLMKEGSQAWVLVKSAPYLHAEALQVGLTTARSIDDLEDRARALIGLASHLHQNLQSEVIQEALAAGRAIEDEDRRAETLLALAPHLPKALQRDVLQESLKIFRRIGRVWEQEDALAVLALDLPGTLGEEALKEDLQIALELARRDPQGTNRHPHRREKPRMLTSLAIHLSALAKTKPDSVYAIWKTALHQLAMYPRRTFFYLLHDLMPLTLTLGKDEKATALDIFRSIRTVTHWWP
jgi:hypothetical protein